MGPEPKLFELVVLSGSVGSATVGTKGTIIFQVWVENSLRTEKDSDVQGVWGIDLITVIAEDDRMETVKGKKRRKKGKGAGK